jgi:hypothetical protein
LKAKAASTSITNAIKVNAENACGKSNDYSNLTALSILNCSTVPNKPGSITINPTSVAVGSNFTASILAVDGASGYTWNTPSGLSIVSGQNTIKVTYKTSTTGTVASGTIKVYATNACGNGDTMASNVGIAVNTTPCSDYTVTRGVYEGPNPCPSCPSSAFPADLINSYGFTRLDNSLCVSRTIPTERVSWSTAVAGCAAMNTPIDVGWRLPNATEALYYHYLSSSQGGGLIHLWTSTELSASTAYWYWASTSRQLTEAGKTRTDVAYMRCVRSL